MFISEMRLRNSAGICLGDSVSLSLPCLLWGKLAATCELCCEETHGAKDLRPPADSRERTEALISTAMGIVPCQQPYNELGRPSPIWDVRRDFPSCHPGCRSWCKRPWARGPSYAVSRFLTHRICDKINVCCLKSVSIGVTGYTAVGIINTPPFP